MARFRVTGMALTRQVVRKARRKEGVMWAQRCGRVVATGALVAGGALAAIGLAGPASATVLANQYVEVPQCQPNTSQQCPQEPEVKFTVPPGSKVQAFFTANANHCSDINVRLIKDDPTTKWYPASDWMRAGPGQTVAGPFITFPAGVHTIRVQAEGILGGCNTGRLDAWGGTLRVESTAIPTEAPKPSQSFPLPFSPPPDLHIG